MALESGQSLLTCISAVEPALPRITNNSKMPNPDLLTPNSMLIWSYFFHGAVHPASATSSDRGMPSVGFTSNKRIDPTTPLYAQQGHSDDHWARLETRV
jgi:hypothetical protein